MFSLRNSLRGLVIVSLVALGALVQAKLMRVPITFTTTLNGAALNVQAISSSGFPINLGKFEIVLTDAKQSRTVVPLKEKGANGLYVGRAPSVTPGEFKFLMRDVTYPEEILEVEKQVTWPPNVAFGLTLTPPPRVPVSTGPSLPMILAAGLAVLLGVVFVFRKRWFGAGKLSSN
jgi:hypothetical protein